MLHLYLGKVQNIHWLHRLEWGFAMCMVDFHTHTHALFVYCSLWWIKCARSVAALCPGVVMSYMFHSVWINLSCVVVCTKLKSKLCCKSISWHVTYKVTPWWRWWSLSFVSACFTCLMHWAKFTQMRSKMFQDFSLVPFVGHGCWRKDRG